MKPRDTGLVCRRYADSHRPGCRRVRKVEALVRQSTRKEKPVRSRKLQLGLAAAAVIALAVTLGVRRGVIDVLLMVGIVAAVGGMYLLRRYARARLVYNRHVESPARLRLPRIEEGSCSCQQSRATRRPMGLTGGE